MIQRKKDRRPQFLLLLLLIAFGSAWLIARSYSDHLWEEEQRERKASIPQPDIRPAPPEVLEGLRALDDLNVSWYYAQKQAEAISTVYYPVLTFAEPQAAVAATPRLRDDIQFLTQLREEVEERTEAVQALSCPPELEGLREVEIECVQLAQQRVGLTIELLQRTVEKQRGLTEEEMEGVYDQLGELHQEMKGPGASVVRLRRELLKPYRVEHDAMAAWMRGRMGDTVELRPLRRPYYPKWQDRPVSPESILERLRGQRERLQNSSPPHLFEGVAESMLADRERLISMVEAYIASPPADREEVEALLAPLEQRIRRTGLHRSRLAGLYRI